MIVSDGQERALRRGIQAAEAARLIRIENPRGHLDDQGRALFGAAPPNLEVEVDGSVEVEAGHGDRVFACESAERAVGAELVRRDLGAAEAVRERAVELPATRVVAAAGRDRLRGGGRCAEGAGVR